MLQQRSRGIQFEREFLPTEFGMGGDLIDIDELLQRPGSSVNTGCVHSCSVCPSLSWLSCSWWPS